MPEYIEEPFQWFAFGTFAALLCIPWLICVYRIIVYPIGRKKQIKHELHPIHSPKVMVVMPVYKEQPESLFKALDSLVSCDYPPDCLHVFLSFDGDDVDALYLQLLRRLNISISLNRYPQSIDTVYNRVRVTISRFPHGGKRHCQKATYRLINKIYQRYISKKDDLFILFIDSDCILDRVCIQNFMYEMQLEPGSEQNILAMTGVITSCTEKNSFITLLQDIEYVHGQMFERSIESGCGAITCLPGALTMLRFSAFRNIARFYFSDRAEQCDDLFDYGKTHLGEDRWLTHLFMIGAKKPYQIQMCMTAFCKTEAVQTFHSLLKQRRRWFLGFITNEVCMLTDSRLWRKYPLLCLIRFMQNTIRTTALLFVVMILSVASTATRFEQLPWQFIAISLGLNWLMMIFFAFKLGRWKCVLYPVMFMMNPFMNWIYMTYGIFTAGQRTWGGPRADAAAADATVTPQDTIDYAALTGDDLNVMPETFRPAIEAHRAKKPTSRASRRRLGRTSLQPSSGAEGRFTSMDDSVSSSADWSSKVDPITEKDGSRLDDLAEISDVDSEDVSIHTPIRASQLGRPGPSRRR